MQHDPWVFLGYMLHSLMNIPVYHCRAFVKVEGGALCSIVYVVRELDGEGSCGLSAYALVELSWMVFEAGSELKLVTDGVVGASKVTFVPLV